MMNKYDPIRNLTQEDRDEIYKFAMERSREMTENIEHHELTDSKPMEMDFSDALREAKNGEKIYRKIWVFGGREIKKHIRIVPGDGDFKPYLAAYTKYFVPWTPDQEDLLAEDWLVL